MLAEIKAKLSKTGDETQGIAELAIHLAVPQRVITDWLSGKNTPFNEATFLMFQWVLEQEAKIKKTPQVLRARAGRKTQERKSRSNEKPKSSPKGH